MARGTGWGHAVGQEPIRLHQGDLIVFPQGDAHVLSSARGSSAVSWAWDAAALQPAADRATGGDSLRRVGIAGHGGLAEHVAERCGSRVWRALSRQREHPRSSVGADVRGDDSPVPSRPCHPSRPGGSLACAIPSSGRRCRRSTPSRRKSGRSSGSRGLSASRGRSSLNGLPGWWVTRPCTTWRSGACSSRRDCCSKGARLRRLPWRSAMNRRRRSVVRSRNSWASRRRRGARQRAGGRLRHTSLPKAGPAWR